MLAAAGDSSLVHGAEGSLAEGARRTIHLESKTGRRPHNRLSGIPPATSPQLNGQELHELLAKELRGLLTTNTIWQGCCVDDLPLRTRHRGAPRGGERGSLALLEVGSEVPWTDGLASVGG